MAKFTKSANNTITLISNGSDKDGLKVAQWARNLKSSCDGDIITKNVATQLSAAHLVDCCIIHEITLTFKDYFFNDIGFWVGNCKPT